MVTVAKLLTRTDLFSSVDFDTCQEIAQQCQIVHCPKDDVLIRQGEHGDKLYVLLGGRLRARTQQDDQDVVLGEFVPGEYVGEIALCRDQPRTATVEAVTDSELVALSRDSFERLLERAPGLRSSAEKTIARRQRISDARTFRPRAEELIRFLNTTSLFGSLDEDTLARLEREMQWVSVLSGEVLIRQGEIGDCMYLIVSGRLSVYLERGEGLELVVTELGRGESMGEMALLTDEPRFASVRAVRDSEVVRISRDLFDRLIQEHPRAMTAMARRLVTYLKRSYSESPTPQAARTIAVVPLHKSLSAAAVCEKLKEALARSGKAIHVDAPSVDEALGAGASEVSGSDTGNWHLTYWLNKQEEDHRFVVYEADSEPSAWTRRCIRQADQILLLASSRSSPQPMDLEEIVERTAPLTHKELVLIHPSTTSQPRGTAEWLEPRAVTTCYHLCADRTEDVDRLGRILSGTSVGLVLGGGGARGFAHIGVIRALREARIPIDRLGGTSMGAVIAAQCALGWSAEEMLERNRDAWIASKPMKDYTFPAVSILAARRFKAFLNEMFGDLDIEDLMRNYFCVSTNLSLASENVHRTGTLRRAVGASMCIPGIAPPMLERGDLLVDGSVLNVLPGDVMRAQGAGDVIAVDVQAQRKLTAPPGFDESPSGWELLFSRLLPFRQAIDMPGIKEIIYASATLRADITLERVKGHTKHYLRPPVQEFATFDFAKLEQIAEMGYRYAAKEIARWGQSDGDEASLPDREPRHTSPMPG